MPRGCLSLISTGSFCFFFFWMIGDTQEAPPTESGGDQVALEVFFSFFFLPVLHFLQPQVTNSPPISKLRLEGFIRLVNDTCPKGRFCRLIQLTD